MQPSNVDQARHVDQIVDANLLVHANHGAGPDCFNASQTFLTRFFLSKATSNLPMENSKRTYVHMVKPK
jgi:hypothetical protein